MADNLNPPNIEHHGDNDAPIPEEDQVAFLDDHEYEQIPPEFRHFYARRPQQQSENRWARRYADYCPYFIALITIILLGVVLVKGGLGLWESFGDNYTKATDGSAVVTYVSTSLTAPLLIDIAVATNLTCPSGYSIIDIGTWYGTNQGCACGDQITYGSCGDSSSGCQDVPAEAPVTIDVWENITFCAKYSSDVTYTTTTDCPTGYTKCYRDICVKSTSECYITDIVIRQLGAADNLKALEAADLVSNETNSTTNGTNSTNATNSTNTTTSENTTTTATTLNFWSVITSASPDLPNGISSSPDPLGSSTTINILISSSGAVSPNGEDSSTVSTAYSPNADSSSATVSPDALAVKSDLAISPYKAGSTASVVSSPYGTSTTQTAISPNSKSKSAISPNRYSFLELETSKRLLFQDLSSQVSFDSSDPHVSEANVFSKHRNINFIEEASSTSSISNQTSSASGQTTTAASTASGQAFNTLATTSTSNSNSTSTTSTTTSATQRSSTFAAMPLGVTATETKDSYGYRTNISINSTHEIRIFRRTQVSPITGFALSTDTLPCLASNREPMPNSSSIYPLLIDQPTGCGEYGVDTDSMEIDHLSEEEVYLENGMVYELLELVGYDTYIASNTLIWSARPRVLLNTATSCFELDLSYIATVATVVSKINKMNLIYLIVFLSYGLVGICAIGLMLWNRNFLWVVGIMLILGGVASAVGAYYYLNQLQGQQENSEDYSEALVSVATLDCFTNTKIKTAMNDLADALPTYISQSITTATVLFYVLALTALAEIVSFGVYGAFKMTS